MILYELTEEGAEPLEVMELEDAAEYVMDSAVDGAGRASACGSCLLPGSYHPDCPLCYHRGKGDRGGDERSALIAILSDFILALREVEVAVVFCHREDGIKISVRSEDTAIYAGPLIHSALRGYGDGGSHAEMVGGMIRKENVHLFKKVSQRHHSGTFSSGLVVVGSMREYWVLVFLFS